MADIRIVPALGAINVTGSADFRGDSASTVLFVSGSGNVGVGTSNPISRLHVAGAVKATATTGHVLGTSTDTGRALSILNSGLAHGESYSMTLGYANSSNNQAEITYYLSATGSTSNRLSLGLYNSSDTLNVVGTGRVGVGITNPSYTLHTVGQVAIQNAEADIWMINTGGGAGTWRILGSSGNTTRRFRIYDHDNSADRFNIETNGQIKFNTYGSGTFTGTAAKTLAVDSSGNVIEVNNASLSGTGTANRVAYWTDSSTLAADADFSFDGTNVGIGTTSPSYGLHIWTNRTLRVEGSAASNDNYGFSMGGAGSFKIDAPNIDGGRLIVNNAGRVGIGTNSPSAKVSISGSNDDFATGVLELIANGSNLKLGGTGVVSWIQSHNSQPLYINKLGNNVIFNIDGGGVGIGTTGTSAKLYSYQSGTWDGSNYAIRANSYSTFNGIRINGADQERDIYQENSSYGLGIATSGAQPIKFLISDSVEVMRVAGGGNVGIGTTSPAAKLHVSGSDAILRNAFIGEVPTYGSANAQFSHIGRAGAGEYSFLSAVDGETYINSKTGYNINFRVNNSNVAIITSGGSIGVGTTSPTSGIKLDVRGYIASNVNSDGVEGGFYLGNSGHGIRRPGGASNDVYVFTTSGTLYLGAGGSSSQQVTVLTGGSVGVGTTNPAQKLHVAGVGRFDSNIQIYGDWNTTYPVVQLLDSKSGGATWNIENGRNSNNLEFYSSGVAGTVFTVLHANGNVGIGSTAPGYKLDVNGDARISSDLTVSGKITAREFHTTFVSASIIYQSGSTKFGNSSDDVHSFTGAIGLNGSDANFPFFVSDPSTAGTRYSLANKGMGFNLADDYAQLQLYGGSGAYIDFANAAEDFDARIIYFGGDRLQLSYGTDLVINSTGVGIGTSGPTAKLHVYDNSDVWHTRIGGASGELRIGGQHSSGAVMQAYTPGGTVRDLYIQRDGGNVGIGNTGPSGKLHVTSGGGDGSAIFRITGTASDSFNWASSTMYANLTAGEVALHQIGKAESQYNAGHYGYRHVSDGSTSNMLTMGMFQADYLVNILATGNVGIGTSTPSNKLQVIGGVTATSFTGSLQGDITGTAASETLATVTGRGASTSTASTFSGGLTTNLLSFTAPTGDPSPLITSRVVPAGQGNASEVTELILFHSNDPYNSAGPDYITLRSPAIRLQTYNDATVDDIDDDLGSNDRIRIEPNGTIKLSSLTSNGFVKTSAGDGTLSVDTNTYLTAEADTLATVTARGASTATDVAFGANSGGDLGIQIRYGSGAGDYGRIRFYQNSSNHSTIHSFSAAWQSGTVFTSAGAINITGQNGVTFGAWNDIDAAIVTGGVSYFKGSVGIGTTGPGAKLDVTGNVRTSTYYNFNGNPSVPTSTTAAIFDQAGVGPTISGLNITFRTDSSTPAEIMRVSSGGNVGIGTTSPGSKLHVAGAITVGASVSSFVYGTLQYVDSTTGVELNAPGLNMTLGTGYNEKLTIKGGQSGLQVQTNDGVGNYTDRLLINQTRSYFNTNVGIGTTSPGAKLDVSGNALISGNIGVGTTAVNQKVVIAGDNGQPATSSTTQYGMLRLHAANGVTGYGEALDMGMHVGISGPASYAWLQATNTTNLALTYNLALNPNGGTVNVKTTTSTRGFNVAGSYYLQGAAANYSSYTPDGLFNAAALPMFIGSGGYSGTYGRFGAAGGLVLGYQDNGSGLYSPAYAFEVKSTDGAGNTNRVVKAITIKNVDTDAEPLIIYNNGALTTSNVVTANSWFVSETNKTVAGGGPYDWTYLGAADGNASRAAAVQIGDVSGAKYAIMGGSYDLTFAKHDADANAWATVMRFNGVDANDGLPTVTIPNDLTVSGTITGNITGTAGSETLSTVTGRGASTSTALALNGRVVQGGGSSRSTSGTTVAFTTGTTYSANTDAGDGARYFSIVNESGTTNTYAQLGFRSDPASAGAGNAMMDMKFVNLGSTSSKLAHVFLHGGNWVDRVTFMSSGNVGIGNTDPSTAKLVVTSAGAAFSSTATKGGNMNGIAVVATTNENTMTGIWFASGEDQNGTHWSGIAGSRSNYTTDWSTHLAFYTHVNASSNINDTTEKMRITGEGNVGIGTTNPVSRLEVYDSANASSFVITSDGANEQFKIRRYSNTNEQLILGFHSSDYGYIQAVEQAVAYRPLAINPNGGNVGIGTTSPDTKLTVSGQVLTVSTLNSSLGSYAIDHPGINTWRIGVTNSNTSTFSIGNDTGGNFANKLFSLTAAGSIGIGTTSPGEKLDVVGNIALSGIFKGTSTGENKNFASYDWHWLGRRYDTYVGDVRLKLYEYFYSTTAAVQEAFVNCYDMSSVNYMGENIWGDVHSYHAIFTTHIYVKRQFTVSSVLLNGDDPYALWVDGAYVAGADSCCTGTTYSYTFTQGWHRLDLIYSEGGGGHFVQLGWNPKDYTDYIAAMTPFGPVNLFDTGDVTMRNNRVGIGTTNPSYKLHVVDGDDSIAYFGPNSTWSSYLAVGSGGSKVGSEVAQVISTDGNLHLDSANNGNAIYIQYYYAAGNTYINAAGGSVGVGTTAPSYKLDVTGTIRATGDVIAYSDRRVKENIVTLENSLDLVTKLRGVEYNKIGEEDKKIGVIAQEVLEVLPQVVQQDNDGNYSVAYGNMAGLFIEAIKQQQTHIQTLEDRISVLEQLLRQKL
jgi:hypothetical protein